MANRIATDTITWSRRFAIVMSAAFAVLLLGFAGALLIQGSNVPPMPPGPTNAGDTHLAPYRASVVLGAISAALAVACVISCVLALLRKLAISWLTIGLSAIVFILATWLLNPFQ